MKKISPLVAIFLFLSSANPTSAKPTPVRDLSNYMGHPTPTTTPTGSTTTLTAPTLNTATQYDTPIVTGESAHAPTNASTTTPTSFSTNTPNSYEQQPSSSSTTTSSPPPHKQPARKVINVLAKKKDLQTESQ